MKIEQTKYQNGLYTITTEKESITVKIDKEIDLDKKEFTSFKDLNKIETEESIKEKIIHALLTTTNYAYNSFNQIKKIPRPITLFFENEQCKIGTVSLDAKSITKAIWANEQIYKKCKKLNFKKTMIKTNKATEQICKIINEQIQATKNQMGCTLQIAIVYKRPQKKEELLRLIEKYNVIYIENPFDNESDYKICNEKTKQKCLIATTYEPKEQITNARALHKINIPQILNQEKKCTTIVHVQTKKDVHIATGCEIPLIIYEITNNEIPKTIHTIEETIKSSN